jgi:eukaryotic-like serine/threonine-protein kinase
VTGYETNSENSVLHRWMTRTPLLLSRHLWLWPLLGAVVLSLVGVWVRNRVEGTTKAELGRQLQTVLDANVAALRLWVVEQEYDAKSFASDDLVQGAIAELVTLAQDPDVAPAALIDSLPARTLRLQLQPLLEAQHYLDYVVIGPDNRILASPRTNLVARTAPEGYRRFVEKARAGQLVVSQPFAGEPMAGPLLAGPTMFVASPVRSANGAVIAVLGLRMKPEDEFSGIFSVGRMGETGESFAFDRGGIMLTASRFDPELKALGLIPDRPGATAILNLKLLNPGADLKRGEHPTKPRDRLHLTQMATVATKGLNGIDVRGYRDHRGVRVVGAWAWLPEQDLGVATEVAADEAFQTLYVLRRAFLLLFTLLTLSGVAIFAFTLLVERLQASIRRSTLAARRLGQYVLLEEIGRGANGMVYRARHALLRRPVAIKLLSPELTNEDTTVRFEHEVQITSQLTHPNTVAIYDYGRTPEGLFYYAMEYLTGINLDQLVRQFGPQPEGRVVHILHQVCGSLAEAHRSGLIHRDVKPANVVLTQRHELYDFVKVLDFGLVKAVEWGPKDGPAARGVVGTPHFMSPESIEAPETVDTRSDLYSVGAVGYWMLTGKTLFDTDDLNSLLLRQVREGPAPPSRRLGRKISPDLEAVIMQCLAKRPEQRPRNIEVLRQSLMKCSSADTWTSSDAEAWWRENAAAMEPSIPAMVAERTLVMAPRA